ncbi:MAG TPA: DOMON-like domain-containing protein [Novosphingobium sp.]|nr:DOMON-like domain-containing protein [Novosphingobium sp.]
MASLALICHPQTPALAVTGIVLRWSAVGGRIILRWQVDGAEKLVVPPFAGKGRADNLWQHTCFELFLKGPGEAYREFNFSPSERWAAYAFERYREGMTQAPLSDTPQIVAVRGDHILTHTVTLPGDVLGDGVAAGISAVIEEAGGHKSYWALAHAPGQPDFHNAACFTLAIGAAEAP